MKLAILFLLLGMTFEAWGQAAPGDDSKTEAGVVLERRDDCCSLKLTDTTVATESNQNSVAESTIGKTPANEPNITK